jgi:hypothetical protein
MFTKVILIIFILTLLTVRITKDNDGWYTVQWGLIPLIEYYKNKRQKKG